MLVKLLGGMDLVAGLAFLLLIFGMIVPSSFLFFSAGFLLVKGSVFFGDMLSKLDLVAAFILILSAFFVLPTIFLFPFIFLLMVKGTVSFF